MTRIIGEGSRAGVGRFEANFQVGVGQQADDNIELECERIARAGFFAIDETHADGVLMPVVDGGELRVAGEAVLRHGPGLAAFIAPKILFSVDEMARDEGEEDRVTAAHLQDIRPSRRCPAR